ncbi:Mrp family chromosome partitioning ATPase/capsular polysaccharide biosynthesis protein [Mesorhizobium soli]|uniref:Wzz/FepE/Etk N-terminal domain-containing protein n=1 Tax=Pseudaminobacter soli (ex Li et al. 2025) TaxID=1295366 RepID=UPI00247706C7|nr:Wzz/FepE/Etk N-terminal domain-containing protein [Mesorhizobium soli]MDH6229563.1 Mrp family chromosome partitioning ATPase/capsular polysaccharide biosynthesis protein [Mesorhizobium soli]
MSGIQSTAGDIDVDLRKLCASLAGSWVRILVVALVVTGVAFALASMLTPRYRAETRVLIETRESASTRTEPAESDGPILNEEGVASQVEVISSTDILKQAAKDLGLAKLAEFDPSADMSLPSRLLIIAGLKADPREILAEERVLKAMRERLNVYRVERSRVIVVEFSSRDPKLAAEVPDAIADAYLKVGQDAKLASNSDASYMVSSGKDRSYLPADARIFSRAAVPSEPYFPKIIPIVSAAFVASLLLMAVGTLLRELFSGRAMRPAPGARFAPVEQVAMPVVMRDESAEDEPLAEMPTASELAKPKTMVSVLPEAPRSVERSTPLARPVRKLGEIGIERAAERLISDGATCAIFVSPEGDEAAATAVLVAREIADVGLRVLLLDLTTSGAASRPMLDGGRYPGITNLLAAQAQFTDVIHADHYSGCHVIPVGTADPARAMRAVDRLPIILESLTTAYDIVVVECGPIDADGIRRLVGEGTEVIVSLIEPGEEIMVAAENLRAGGFPGLILVTPSGYERPNWPATGRNAA